MTRWSWRNFFAVFVWRAPLLSIPCCARWVLFWDRAWKHLYSWGSAALLLTATKKLDIVQAGQARRSLGRKAPGRAVNSQMKEAPNANLERVAIGRNLRRGAYAFVHSLCILVAADRFWFRLQRRRSGNFARDFVEHGERWGRRKRWRGSGRERWKRWICGPGWSGRRSGRSRAAELRRWKR